MAKTCYSCGFTQNPDNAYYCGKCGNPLNWIDDYKLYNAYFYVPVSKSTLSDYKRYEQQVKSSWMFNTFDKLKAWWRKDGSDLAWAAGGFIALFFGFFFLFNTCSSDSDKLQRIEIDGKYGIGYSADKMILPARYDSISKYGIGNQWIICDKTTRLEGLAYVNDSTYSVIDPKFGAVVSRNENGLAILRLNKVKNEYYDSLFVATNGRFLNETKYLRIGYPHGRWGNNDCLVATISSNQAQILGKDGMPINGKTYYHVVIDEDSVIRAVSYAPTSTKYKKAGMTTLHNYSGEQVSDKEFYYVEPFSDGVAWAQVTAEEGKKSVYSLIDRDGHILFNNKPASGGTVAFGDGIGWYKLTRNSDTFIAVSKRGEELFKIKAQGVYPFTMGLAPVEKGTSYYDKKMGFVDKTGKVVIPFKYKHRYSNPHFGSDSIMRYVSLDGVEGKLHRNGSFTPDI